MLKKIMLSSVLLTGILGVSAVSSPELGLIKAKAETNNATETAYLENQQYISDGIESTDENTNGVERPFAPNFSNKNNLIEEKAVAAFDWRYYAYYNFSRSIQVKKTVPVANNGYIKVAIQNNKYFNFKVVVKSLSSGNTVTHTVKGGPMSGGNYVINTFGPMKAGNYVVTLVNTDNSWHKGVVWLGW
ncbi:hypothetical protein COE51_23125 [Bacillus pseudomycoides]|nr:hypothetical protein COE51_23125 [Bacillus pseudomycoides]